MDGFDKAFLAFWFVGVLATLAFWGVVVWAIIKLVNANS
jgi:hypothetical protein